MSEVVFSFVKCITDDKLVSINKYMKYKNNCKNYIFIKYNNTFVLE